VAAPCGRCDVCTGTVAAASEDRAHAAVERLPRGPRAKAKAKPAVNAAAANAALAQPRQRSARGIQRISGVQLDLDTYRKRTARALRWKPYMVLQQSTIVAIDAQRPTTLSALERIPGLGPAKIAKFGRDLLAIVARNRQ